MQGNLPKVPIYDFVIKDGDLVVATHGRSFWILDDLTQLHQVTEEINRSPFRLLKPHSTHRVSLPTRVRKSLPGKNYWITLDADVTFTEVKEKESGIVRKFLDAGENPPDGVIVNYYLKDKPAGEIILKFMDSSGQIISTFSNGISPFKFQVSLYNFF